MPVRSITSVMFGGDDLKDIYVTIRGLKARTTVTHDFVAQWQEKALAAGIRPATW
ncbi:MAG: hypothetical protein AAGF58_04570 [Pseudomonadota bacterium]